MAQDLHVHLVVLLASSLRLLLLVDQANERLARAHHAGDVVQADVALLGAGSVGLMAVVVGVGVVSTGNASHAGNLLHGGLLSLVGLVGGLGGLALSLLLQLHGAHVDRTQRSGLDGAVHVRKLNALGETSDLAALDGLAQRGQHGVALAHGLGTSASLSALLLTSFLWHSF